MKIVEQTPNRLTLQENRLQWIIPSVLFGSLFLIVGLFQTLSFARLTTLKCQRVQLTQERLQLIQGSCQLVESSLLGSDQTEIPLNQLQGAKVDENEDSDENTYRVVLLTTSTGEVPFTSIWSSGTEEKQENADRINAFIHNPRETSLNIQQDERWPHYLVGGIFLLVGGGLLLHLLLYGKLIVSCTLDKTQGLIRLQQRNLRRTKVTEHRLREINQVEVEAKRDSDGDQTYSVRINLRSGESIPLTFWGINNEEVNQRMAKCIREFLNLNA